MKEPAIGAREFRQRVEQWIAEMSSDDQLTVLKWLDVALRACDAAQRGSLIYGLISGTYEITGVRNGEPTFRMTRAARREFVESVGDLAAGIVKP